MIVIEEILSELFQLIPVRQWKDSNDIAQETPKPKYHFGDTKEANRFIIAQDTKAYPLIYQTSTRQLDTRKWSETTLTLVLATRNTELSLYNTERWAMSYRNVLLPLLDDVKRCLERSGVIASDFDYNIDKRPNYSETDSKDKNKFVDIVDAIILSLDVRFIKACINKDINFKR